MPKKLISEGIASKIAKLIFKGYAPQVKKAVKGNKELQKAIGDVDDALKRFDALVKKQEKLSARK